MHDKGIRGQVLIDTLDRYPQLTFDHHATDTTVDTQQYTIDISVNSRSTVD